MLIYAREGLANLLSTLADWPAAFAMIDDLEQQVQADGPTLRRAALSLNQGNMTLAEEWVERMNISLTDSAEQMADYPAAYLELIRPHLLKREFEGTISQLSILATMAEEMKVSLSY